MTIGSNTFQSRKLQWTTYLICRITLTKLLVFTKLFRFLSIKKKRLTTIYSRFVDGRQRCETVVRKIARCLAYTLYYNTIQMISVLRHHFKMLFL